MAPIGNAAQLNGPKAKIWDSPLGFGPKTKLGLLGHLHAYVYKLNFWFEVRVQLGKMLGT